MTEKSSCACAGSSVQWGAWAALGMASANAALLARIERSGMGVINPARGLAALQAILSGSSSSRFAPSIIASPFSWGSLLQQAKAVPPVFAEHAELALAPEKAGSGILQAQRRPVALVVHASDTVLPQVLGIVQGMLGALVSAPAHMLISVIGHDTSCNPCGVLHGSQILLNAASSE